MKIDIVPLLKNLKAQTVSDNYPAIIPHGPKLLSNDQNKEKK
jgi:hypothetical protein